jgi:ATP-binding cassette subfamily B protein
VTDEPTPRRHVSIYDVARTPPDKKSLKLLPSLIRGAISLVWRAGKGKFLFAAGLQALAGVGLAAQLLIARSVLAAVLQADRLGAGFEAVLPRLIVLAGITMLLSLATLLRAEQERVLGELVGRQSSDEVLEVAEQVELIAYETPEFYDRLQRAKFNAGNRPVLMVSGLLRLMTALFSIIGVVIALVAIQPFLVPLAIFAYIPFWLATSRNSKAFYDFSYGITPDDRVRNYLFSILTGREFAKEVRAFGIGRHLRRRHRELYDERVERLKEVVRRRLRRSLIASLSSSLLSAAALSLAIFLLLSGQMTAAETAAAIWAVVILGQRLRGVNSGAGSLYESALFIEDFTSFINLKPGIDRTRPTNPAPPRFKRLTVENVTFTYPESRHPALDGVDLVISEGETVALVGDNGSGKTTLAKLLADLHRPDSGQILWDDTDIAGCDPDQVRASIAVLFQDFVHYHLTAHENIALGRVEKADDRAAVIRAAHQAKAADFLAKLPEGYDTLLSRMFTGGIDLSIGQWQRISLARAFFRSAPFIIMDEPTASLDARAEYEIFASMKELAGDSAVLLISHRFSSVRSADRIYVLHEGRIVETGSHDDLIEMNGRYAEMFRLQAGAYLGPTISTQGHETSPARS